MKKNVKALAALFLASFAFLVTACPGQVDITPPAEVTDITVTAANGNAVLTWENPKDEDFAGVKISMTPAVGTLVNPVMIEKTVTSFSVSGLTIGEEYTFTIQTFDASLNYSVGKTKKATVADTSDKIAPAEVTELKIEAADGEATLTWVNPEDSDFAGVKISVLPAEGSLENAVILEKGVTKFDVSGLTIGNEYTFTIQTFDESLNYSEGASQTATVADTSDKTPPAEVSEIKLTAANGNAVLEWKNPTDEDFAGVKITMTPAAGTLENAVRLEKTVKSLSVSGLTIGEEYSFTIQTFDASLNYSVGATQKATVADTSDKTAPAEVTELKIEAADGNAKLTWKNPEDSDLAGVKISMSPATGTLENEVILTGNKTTFTVSGLENDAEYTFTIQTFDGSLNYSEGASQTATVADTSDKTPPAEVTNITITPQLSGGILTWTDPADEDLYGIEISYKKGADSNARAALTKLAENTIVIAPGTEKYTLTDLERGEDYTVTFKTMDLEGNKSDGLTEVFTVVDLIEAFAEPVSEGIKLTLKYTDAANGEYGIKDNGILECNTGLFLEWPDTFNETGGVSIIFPFTESGKEYVFEARGNYESSVFNGWYSKKLESCTATTTTKEGTWYENNKDYFSNFTVDCKYNFETEKVELVRNFPEVEGLKETEALAKIKEIKDSVLNLPANITKVEKSFNPLLFGAVNWTGASTWKANGAQELTLDDEISLTETAYLNDWWYTGSDLSISGFINNNFDGKYSGCYDYNIYTTNGTWVTPGIWSDQEYSYVGKVSTISTTNWEVSRVLHAVFDSTYVKYFVRDEEHKTVAKGTSLKNLAKTSTGLVATGLAHQNDYVVVYYTAADVLYTFDAGEGKFSDGSSTLKMTGKYGTAVGDVEWPTRDGYLFTGWESASGVELGKYYGEENLTFTANYEKLSENFVTVPAASITGTEEWTPSSNVFVSGRALEISSFYMCDHEVTQDEFKAVMGTNPSTIDTVGDAGNNPVDSVSWYDAIAYCNKRSAKEGLTPCYTISGITDWKNFEYSSIPTSGDSTWDAVTCDWTANGYRLPTNAEWEWASRGGKNYTYSGSNDIDDVAWYSENSDGKTHEVKQKDSNAYGLYDMSGNVLEFCWDWGTGSVDSSTDATGPASGSNRVLRGGGWYNLADSCSVSCWGYYDPGLRNGNHGFRVVRSISE